jgi:two-component system sensor histidine kinase DegS
MLFNFNKNTDSRLRMNLFARLGTWYILALSIVASVVIIGQVLIQRHLKDQLNDSHVVNVAGKQRMLSQKISKTVLLLQDKQSAEERKNILNELNQSVALWKISQQALMNGNDSLKLPGKNSEEIIRLLTYTDVHFKIMSQNSSWLINSLKKDLAVSFVLLKPFIEKILNEESFFLQGMEKAVSQYDKEAQNKITRLSYLENALLIISLLVIAIEIIFIFRPTAFHVNKTVNKLVASEKNSKKMADEIRELYASLEKSYEQISQINQPIENPRIFAKSDAAGEVIFISSAFSELSGKEKLIPSLRLCDLFDDLNEPNDWMDDWLDTTLEGKHWEGEISFKDVKGKPCWVAVIISPVYNEKNEIEELVMMGSDITKRKMAEQNMNRKNQAEIEKRINQQKFRSVLILEGQEEERKRIAMDIHDGIGQMLTSLKYQVESIDFNADEKTQKKLQEIDQLIKQVIKEVRRVTFNLKPTVLGDYGLQAALNVFIKEMSKLIDVRLNFKSEKEIERLPQKVENNIFRIIQEAINNAIKYAEAESIDIILEQGEGELVITVADKGKGFDTRLVEQRSVNIESGRGLFNMYERTEYINGHLEIDSAPGMGTRVTLRVPVMSPVNIDE